MPLPERYQHWQHQPDEPLVDYAPVDEDAATLPTLESLVQGDARAWETEEDV
jgi:hypothetical protein